MNRLVMQVEKKQNWRLKSSHSLQRVQSPLDKSFSLCRASIWRGLIEPIVELRPLRQRLEDWESLETINRVAKQRANGGTSYEPV